jgi:probable F420-dependent oxidoreductase
VVKFGAIFPTTEIGSDPLAIRDWAQAAEALGYEHMIAYDHVLGAQHVNRKPPLGGPYTERDPFHEPLTLFAYLAAVTQRIELATGVLILPQRQTALVAKQAAEVDLLSGGRLRLGVGSGWNYVEYTALGVPWERRGARMEEQVELLRRLWREPIVDYTGKFHRVERAGILPLPGRTIPIWYGAFAPVALQRAARTGDGVFFAAPPSRVQPLHEKLLGWLRDAGRTAAGFGSEASVDFSADPGSWARELELWNAAGGTHLSLRAMDTASEQVGAKRVGYRGPQDYIDALRKFRDALGFGR